MILRKNRDVVSIINATNQCTLFNVNLDIKQPTESKVYTHTVHILNNKDSDINTFNQTDTLKQISNNFKDKFPCIENITSNEVL